MKNKRKKEIEVLQSNYTDKAVRFNWSQWEINANYVQLQDWIW